MNKNNPPLSLYNDVYDNLGVESDLENIIKRIQTGGKGLKEKISECRLSKKKEHEADEKLHQAKRKNDEDLIKKYTAEKTRYETEYDEKKKTLPAVTWSALLPDGREITKEKRLEHSGLIGLDIDGIHKDFDKVLEAIENHKNTFTCFPSPSNKGIKIVCLVQPKPKRKKRINPITQEKEKEGGTFKEHLAAWNACARAYQPLLDPFNLRADPSGKDAGRLCFLSYYPKIKYNLNAEPVTWSVEDTAKTNDTQATEWTAEDDEYIPTAKEKTKLYKFLKTHKGKGKIALIKGPRRRGGNFIRCLNIKEHKAPESKTGTFVSITSHGLWYHCSHAHCVGKGTRWFLDQLGLKRDPFRKYKPREPKLKKIAPPELKRKVTKHTSTKQAHDTLAKEVGEFLLTDNKKQSRIFSLNLPPGTGKSTTVLKKGKGGKVLANVLHTDLALGLVSIARDEGYANAMHLKGRWHNWEGSEAALLPKEMRDAGMFTENGGADGKPLCIMADENQKYVDKRVGGGTYCFHICPFKDTCPHIKQYDKIKTHDFIVTCSPNLLFDLSLRGYLKSKFKDIDLAFIDDFTLNGLYTDISLSKKEFNELKTSWAGTPTGDFAKEVCKAFQKDEPQKIIKKLKKALDTAKTHKKEIASCLTKHARSGTVPVTPAEALAAGIKIENITPVWPEKATPIELLTIFFKTIGNDNHAPLSKITDENDTIITFTIPPQAPPPHIIKDIIMASATEASEGLSRAFKQQPVILSKIEIDDVCWASGVEVYQNNEIKITAGGTFNYEKDAEGEFIAKGLTAAAEKRIRKLNDWAKVHEGLTAFISYKEFTGPMKESVSNFDIIKHFDDMRGLNFTGLSFLVIYGFPKVSHDIVMREAKKQYSRDKLPLPTGKYEDLTEEKEYLSEGIACKERRYKDPRSESIRTQLSIAKLVQAFGRCRPTQWEDTQTIIYTACDLGIITERATLFSNTAFERANKPSEINACQEAIDDALTTGNVQKIIDSTGIKKSQAYKKTKATRTIKKSEREKQILELYSAGKSQRDIARKVGCSNGTAGNVIKKAKKK